MADEIDDPCEIHLKLKFCKVWIVHTIHFSQKSPLKFCSEHGSHNADLSAKFPEGLGN